MRFLADENFNNRILRGIQRENAHIDIQRVQDTDFYEAEDPDVLDYAAREQRILLTHDIKTMPKFAYERVHAGKPMPGGVAIPKDAPVGEVIEDFLIVLGAGSPQDLENQVIYLPL